MKIDGEEVVGYYHAIALAPLAADDCRRERERRGARACSCSRLCARRRRTWRHVGREQIAAQMGDDGDFNPVAPVTREAAAAEGAAPAAAEGPSWAEMAGRHGGSDEYKFFDFSRAMARAVGETIRGAVDGMTGREALRTRFGAADKVGVLGKRSDHLHQWRRRWFVLDGDTLRWAAAPDDAPHGEYAAAPSRGPPSPPTTSPPASPSRLCCARRAPSRAPPRRQPPRDHARPPLARARRRPALRRAARAGGPEPES